MSNETVTVVPVVGVIHILGRPLRVFGDLDNPWFLGRDVSRLLDYKLKNTNELIGLAHIDDQTKFQYVNSDDPKNSGGRKYTATFVTEDGLYDILMRSTMPLSTEFRYEIRNILKGIRRGTHTLYLTSESDGYMEEYKTNLYGGRAKYEMVDRWYDDGGVFMEREYLEWLHEQDMLGV
jgi:prophage antirepressor-like protein